MSLLHINNTDLKIKQIVSWNCSFDLFGRCGWRAVHKPTGVWRSSWVVLKKRIEVEKGKLAGH